MSTIIENYTADVFVGIAPTIITSTTATEKKFIGNLTLTNTGTTSELVYMWLLPTTTTPSTSAPGGNWFDRLTIPGGASATVYKLLGHVIGQSMSLKMQTTTASTVRATMSGTTET
jgi:hypothetical protein